jgi:DNA-binding transcriptional ArsR family regulator
LTSPLDARTPRRVNDHGGAHLHGAINVQDQVKVDVNLNGGVLVWPVMEDRELLRVLKALGHATRFRMVQEIAAAGELGCGEIAERFAVAQPTISHHLKILTDAGVVSIRRAGQHGFCTVNRDLIARATALLPDRVAPRRARSKRAASAPRRRRPAAR